MNRNSIFSLKFHENMRAVARKCFWKLQESVQLRDALPTHHGSELSHAVHLTKHPADAIPSTKSPLRVRPEDENPLCKPPDKCRHHYSAREEAARLTEVHLRIVTVFIEVPQCNHGSAG